MRKNDSVLIVPESGRGNGKQCPSGGIVLRLKRGSLCTVTGGKANGCPCR